MFVIICRFNTGVRPNQGRGGVNRNPQTRGGAVDVRDYRDPRDRRDPRDQYDDRQPYGGRGGAGGRSDNARIFVALFNYDPLTMSPNPGACEEELGFREGQLIKVFGDKDADGFYWGEAGGRSGYVPCNIVSEVQVREASETGVLCSYKALVQKGCCWNVGMRQCV